MDALAVGGGAGAVIFRAISAALVIIVLMCAKDLIRAFFISPFYCFSQK